MKMVGRKLHWKLSDIFESIEDMIDPEISHKYRIITPIRRIGSQVWLATKDIVKGKINDNSRL